MAEPKKRTTKTPEVKLLEKILDELKEIRKLVDDIRYERA